MQFSSISKAPDSSGENAGADMYEAATDALARLDDDDCDALTFCGLINPEAVEGFRSRFNNFRPKPNCRLFIATQGGDIHSAYRIVRSIRRRYEKLILIVTDQCKSAGTLIALGADDIVMSDSGELGPLDVQVLKEDELAKRTSGLDPFVALKTIQQQSFSLFQHHFLEVVRGGGFTISTRMAMENAREFAAALMAPLVGQIDPNRLGELQRAIDIVNAYGERLAHDNLKENALAELVVGYPDHGFVIDYEEAQNLFVSVRAPESWEFELSRHCKELLNPFASKVRVCDVRNEILAPLLTEKRSQTEKGSRNVSKSTSSRKHRSRAGAANGADGVADSSNGSDLRENNAKSAKRPPPRRRANGKGTRSQGA